MGRNNTFYFKINKTTFGTSKRSKIYYWYFDLQYTIRKVRCFLLQKPQKISMFLILHSVCSVQIDSFILFSPRWGKLACPWSFFVQFFYHAWPNHNIGPNQFDIWSNHNDIWTKQIVISDPISLIPSPITQCYLLSFLTQSQWYLME